jgi:hypothetical protein
MQRLSTENAVCTFAALQITESSTIPEQNCTAFTSPKVENWCKNAVEDGTVADST